MLLTTHTGPSPFKGFSHCPFKGLTSVQLAILSHNPNEGLKLIQSTNYNGCTQLAKPGHNPNKGLKLVQTTYHSGCKQPSKPDHKLNKQTPTQSHMQLTKPSHTTDGNTTIIQAVNTIGYNISTKPLKLAHTKKKP